MEIRATKTWRDRDGGWPTAFMYVAIRNMANKIIMPEIGGILCYACNVYHVSVVLAYSRILQLA